jgi:hypothetical protein
MPPPSGEFGEPNNFEEGFGEEYIDPEDVEELEEESDDPIDSLSSFTESLLYLADDNCASKKDLKKFQIVLKELRDLLNKMMRLPGIEDSGSYKALIAEVKSFKSELRSICTEPKEEEEEEEEEEELY